MCNIICNTKITFSVKNRSLYNWEQNKVDIMLKLTWLINVTWSAHDKKINSAKLIDAWSLIKNDCQVSINLQNMFKKWKKDGQDKVNSSKDWFPSDDFFFHVFSKCFDKRTPYLSTPLLRRILSFSLQFFSSSYE